MKTIYEMVWRNRWLTSTAKSPADMVNSLQNAIKEIMELKEDRVAFDFEGAEDDYIFITTTDPKIAEKYGMYEQEQNDEDKELVD